MPNSIISYDHDLPEIEGRLSWERPTSYLVKDPGAPNGWRIDDTERRPSKLLLVPKLRAAVDMWRDDGYPGAELVTKRLFTFWFDEDHLEPGGGGTFRYRFCLREAIETLAYLVEVEKVQDTRTLIDAFATITSKDLFEKSVEYETAIDGKRYLRRYIPELQNEGRQELPPENLRRYAFRMATGSGKTYVMAMLMVWAHYHKKSVPGSPLSSNFLLVAPNIIVYQRLERDFGSNRIFNDLPLIPPDLKPWNQKVIVRGDSAEPDPSGNLFLVNIHQIYSNRDQEWTPANAIEALLGKKPAGNSGTSQRSMLERIKSLSDLIVINDEAHHVHDPDLEWNKTLLSVHEGLPHGLSAWLDFSATPKDQNGMFYPWTLVDYPLAQAVEDRIIKAPIIVTSVDDKSLPATDPDNVTQDEVLDKYGAWLRAAVQRWKVHNATYTALGIKPVLFIMAEKNVIADAIGNVLHTEAEFGFKKPEVLIIHTDNTGEVLKGDLEEARLAANDIDQPSNKYKVVVSVMMLREGWDVKNVSIVLGLRAFSAKAEILPEQVIGRGLRLMAGAGSDTQTLEVLGTKNLLDIVREKLEAEGVGTGGGTEPPPSPVIIHPLRERLAFDIAIPLTKPVLMRNYKNLETADPKSWEALCDLSDLDDEGKPVLKMEFATTETTVHEEQVADGTPPMAQALLAVITKKTMQRAKLSNVFAQIYPLVEKYVSEVCFNQVVDVDSEPIRRFLWRPLLQNSIASRLGTKISNLTVEVGVIEFESATNKLSDTAPFPWKRNLEPEPCVCTKTIFNLVATYNNYERQFALFLDNAPDVVRFASLGTTMQAESSTKFRVDYLKASGAIGMYYPDFVVVQQTHDGEVHWIIETKGRVWEGTDRKDKAVEAWCERITAQTGQSWRFLRVNQIDFNRQHPNRLSDIEAWTGESLLNT